MNTEINYQVGFVPALEHITALYATAGLKRPIDDKQRMMKMFANSNLLITAWQGEHLIGIARSMNDGGFCCYLADLAVHPSYQKRGIGRQLVHLTKATAGDDCSLIWLSAPGAISYYHKIGIQQLKNAFGIERLHPI